jgi:hypothetical protein
MSDISSIPAGASDSSCVRMPSVCAEFPGHGAGRGARPTVPDSGRAMRKSDHVAHPQTSAERPGRQIRSTCDVDLAGDARTGTSFDGYEIVSAIGTAGWGQCSARAAPGSGGTSRCNSSRGTASESFRAQSSDCPGGGPAVRDLEPGRTRSCHRGTAVEPRSGWHYVLPSLTGNPSRARGAESW